MRNTAIGRCLVALRTTTRDLLFRGCAFLAMVIVAVTFGIAQPQNKGEDQTAARAPREQPKREPFWIRTFDDPIAFFTLVLAVSTIGLWIVTWRSGIKQGRQTRQSLAIAKRSADIADLSARGAIQALEVPLLRIFPPELIGISKPRTDGAPPRRRVYYQISQ